LNADDCNKWQAQEHHMPVQQSTLGSIIVCKLHTE